MTFQKNNLSYIEEGFKQMRAYVTIFSSSYLYRGQYYNGYNSIMKRKMTKVVNHVKMEDEDYLDVLFWRSKTMTERLEEVVRLRKSYYTWLDGSFPEKIAKAVTTRLIKFEKDW